MASGSKGNLSFLRVLGLAEFEGKKFYLPHILLGKLSVGCPGLEKKSITWRGGEETAF
jgi:hypothetical protein